MSVNDFRTFIGDPIPYDSTLTPEELSDKVLYMAKLFWIAVKYFIVMVTELTSTGHSVFSRLFKI